jgi:hypothetical protein
MDERVGVVRRGSEVGAVRGEVVRLGADDGASNGCCRNLTDTPAPCDALRGVVGKLLGEVSVWPGRVGIVSNHAAIALRMMGRLRKKVIGHRMSVARRRIGVGMLRRNRRGAFALLHEPARHHCRSIFIEPLIEKRADLFAEIGGVAEARQFIGLQRVSRSGQQKLPRGLCCVSGHGLPPAGTRRSYHRSKLRQELLGQRQLWKTVDIPGAGWRPTAWLANGSFESRFFGMLEACSACPGDYEDPDRTARNVRGAEEGGEIEEEFEPDPSEVWE